MTQHTPLMGIQTISAAIQQRFSIQHLETTKRKMGPRCPSRRTDWGSEPLPALARNRFQLTIARNGPSKYCPGPIASKSSSDQLLPFCWVTTPIDPDAGRSMTLNVISGGDQQVASAVTDNESFDNDVPDVDTNEQRMYD